MLTTKAFFFDMAQLTKDSLISDKMTELEKARIKRDILRPLIHYPFQCTQWRWAR